MVEVAVIFGKIEGETEALFVLLVGSFDSFESEENDGVESGRSQSFFFCNESKIYIRLWCGRIEGDAIAEIEVRDKWK